MCVIQPGVCLSVPVVVSVGPGWRLIFRDYCSTAHIVMIYFSLFRVFYVRVDAVISCNGINKISCILSVLSQLFHSTMNSDAAAL